MKILFLGFVFFNVTEQAKWIIQGRASIIIQSPTKKVPTFVSSKRASLQRSTYNELKCILAFVLLLMKEEMQTQSFQGLSCKKKKLTQTEHVSVETCQEEFSYHILELLQFLKGIIYTECCKIKVAHGSEQLNWSSPGNYVPNKQIELEKGIYHYVDLSTKRLNLNAYGQHWSKIITKLCTWLFKGRISPSGEEGKIGKDLFQLLNSPVNISFSLF